MSFQKLLNEVVDQLNDLTIADENERNIARHEDTLK